MAMTVAMAAATAATMTTVATAVSTAEAGATPSGMSEAKVAVTAAKDRPAPWPCYHAVRA